ncbi:MAG: S8 family serine peptidase [Candidatus Heimdallarchaeota archaeon]|nr:S8 family serine peptidase [Candidatus Heimdallarchaeota archaeon]
MPPKKRFTTIIWVILIVFIVVSISAFAFLFFWNPPRTGGANIKIAVLDSGINFDARIQGLKVSKELENTIILQKNFATTEFGFSTNYSIVDDTERLHGTRVALGIAGQSEGQAPEAKLIIARCTDDAGIATYPAFLAAFQWAVDEADAAIINISLGGPILYNSSIIEAINKATLDSGVLTVVSAGNSGDAERYATSSIEGPGDALQAITVGALSATGVAPYSSLGPLKDHRVKPDLVDSGYSLGQVGTSFSAPKITAKAAVLMSWCQSQGLKTTPGLIKAALMNSAKISSEDPVHFAGAGLPDLEEAKRIISEAQKVSSLPIVSHVSPSFLPFDLSVAFSGDIWHFPLTIISSLEQEFEFSRLSSNSIVSLPSSILVNQSEIVHCALIIPTDFPTGFHNETIAIQTSFGESLELNVAIAIETPLIRIGLDVYHTLWDFDHLFGQFSELRKAFAEQNIALIELTSRENYTQLDSFDGVVLPDPNSYGRKMNESNQLESFFRPFINETINQLFSYVNSGGGLFVISTSSSSSALSETNRLVTQFNITLDPNIGIPVIPMEINGQKNIQLITNLSSVHPITSSIPDFDYFGAGLNITGDNAEAIAWGTLNRIINDEIVNVSKAVLAVYESANEFDGRVVVTGSNFMADNYGINSEYYSQNNLDLLLNVIEWISKKSIPSLTGTYNKAVIGKPTTISLSTVLPGDISSFGIPSNFAQLSSPFLMFISSSRILAHRKQMIVLPVTKRKTTNN